MTFKVKDLMITVLPGDGKGPDALAACPGCSLNISAPTSPAACGCGCTHCSASFYTQGRSCFCHIARPEDLAVLKEQMKQVMLGIEEREREIEETMRPKTLSEVEELETKLTAALAELRSQKEGLR